MEFDFASFFVGILVGLGIAYGIIRMLGKMLYNKLVEDGVIKSVEEEQAESETKRIEMKVEKHGDILYAFRKDNDDFVCQGSNFEELRANFASRFPGYTGSVEGKATELHEELVRQRQELTKTV